jgi:hypothetical protein
MSSPPRLAAGAGVAVWLVPSPPAICKAATPAKIATMAAISSKRKRIPVPVAVYKNGIILDKFKAYIKIDALNKRKEIHKDAMNPRRMLAVIN